jgi:hypothetical protein
MKHNERKEAKQGRKFRKLIVIPVAVGAALAGGYAFAAWTSSATGTGQARSTTSIDSVISPGTNAADLYPGATSSVLVTVTNPNPYPVLVNSISAGTSPLVNGTCVAGTVTSDARTVDATGIVQSDNATKTIAANGSASYTLVTHMTAGALDTCKSQTFTMTLTGALSSNA